MFHRWTGTREVIRIQKGHGRLSGFGRDTAGYQDARQTGTWQVVRILDFLQTNRDTAGCQDSDIFHWRRNTPGCQDADIFWLVDRNTAGCQDADIFWLVDRNTAGCLDSKFLQTSRDTAGCQDSEIFHWRTWTRQVGRAWKKYESNRLTRTQQVGRASNRLTRTQQVGRASNRLTRTQQVGKASNRLTWTQQVGRA
jgi:hypothetical protein